MFQGILKELKFLDVRKNLPRELLAGLLVGIVALPMNIAFAIGSGVSPEKGLIAGVAASLVLTFLGGSKTQISGPTGAFMGLIYGIVTTHGMEGLVTATILAGVILVTLGALKLGRLFRFIPFPVVVGFTAGIAVIIFTSQVNDLLGLGVPKLPKEFFEKWAVYWEHLNRIDVRAVAVAGGTILGIVLLNRLDRRIPAALVMVLAATLVNIVFGLSLDTIESRYGKIHYEFTGIHLALPDLATLESLLLPAISIALLGGIESLLSAIVADRMSGQEHDPDRELFGQGVANMLSGALGSIPITGAIARSATNIRAGGRTPLANFVHGVILFLSLLFLRPYVGQIPMAALAGVLTTVAYNMSEHETFRSLLKGPRGDVVALLATFVLTLVVDLVVAIPVGILAALLVFVRRMSDNTRFQVHRGMFQDVPSEVDPLGQTQVEIPHQVRVVEFGGPLFFGTAEVYKRQLKELESEGHRLSLLRLRDVPSIDASGLRLLEEFIEAEHRNGRRVLLCALRPGVHRAIQKAGVEKLVGAENVLPNVITALNRAEALLGATRSTLADRLRHSGGIVTLHVSDRNEAIRAAFEHVSLPKDEKDKLLQACLLRETVGSTVLPGGLMVPHPRDRHLDPEYPEVTMLFYLDPPIQENAEAIEVMALSLSHTVDSHLKNLAEIVKHFREENFRALLRRRAPLAEILDYLQA